MVKEFRIGEFLTGWMTIREDADQEPKEAEREEKMLKGIAESLAESLNLAEFPAFNLKISEWNYTTGEPGAELKLVKTTKDGTCALAISMARTLFMTRSSQKYKAENHDLKALDYDGKLTIEVIMGGVLDAEGEYDQDANADTLMVLASGFYYRRILQYYPEWTTWYKDSPISVTQSIEHL